MEPSMAKLGIVLGVAVLSVVAVSVIFLNTPSRRERYWASAPTWERVYQGIVPPGMITRGHYMILVDLTVIGVASLVTGIAGVLAPEAGWVPFVMVVGTFMFGVVGGVGVVVVRTGKPRAWIPARFRAPEGPQEG